MCAYIRVYTNIIVKHIRSVKHFPLRNEGGRLFDLFRWMQEKTMKQQFH